MIGCSQQKLTRREELPLTGVQKFYEILKMSFFDFNNLSPTPASLGPHFHSKWPPAVSFQLSLIYGSACAFDVRHILFAVGLPEEPVMSMALRFLHLMTVRVILPAVGR